jgi:hypothetical protein
MPALILVAVLSLYSVTTILSAVLGNPTSPLSVVVVVVVVVVYIGPPLGGSLLRAWKSPGRHGTFRTKSGINLLATCRLI